MKQILILLFTILCLNLQAQKVKQDANGNYIAVKSDKAKKAPVSTGKTYTDSKGRTYPVFSNDKGRIFVLRTSKNTGKEYKQYLN